MPKIRGIKPDIWTDEDFVELTPYARLLWIGMWNYACDNGHLRDRSKQIKMRVLPTDDVNCAELLRELEDNGRIARSTGWITVPNFTKQQKPDKRFFVTCDAPGCTKPGDPERETRSAHVEPTPAHHEPTQRPLGDVDGDGDGELMVIETSRASALTETDRFDEFWDTYGKKNDRKTAAKRWAAAIKKRGVTADLLISAAAAYVLYERTSNQGGRFIMDPSKWLLNERWRDERPQVAPAQTNLQKHMTLVRDLGPAGANPFADPREIGPAS